VRSSDARTFLPSIREGEIEEVRVYSAHLCVVEIGLHAGPTDAGGFFGSAAALPVRFEIDRIGVANLRECAELGGPIDVALVDGRPLRFTSAVLDGVLDVAVVDAVFG
jgi:hypothetical protein